MTVKIALFAKRPRKHNFVIKMAITSWPLWLESINYIPFESNFYELQDYTKLLGKFSKFLKTHPVPTISFFSKTLSVFL